MFTANEGNKRDSEPAVKKRKCIIEDVVLKKTGEVEPVYVTFANGQPVEGADLRGTLHKNISRHPEHHHRQILAVETPGLNYVGVNFGKEVSSLSAKQSVFLGILNKVTGKMRLVETSSYCVRPMLEPTKSTTYEEGKSLNLMTYAEKQEAVTAAFGSKRAKQSVNRRKQYQVNAQNMSEAIDQAVSSFPLKNSELEEDSWEQDTTLAILPKCNREASQPEDVYPLEFIAPDNFLAYMEDSARELLEGKDPDPKSTLLFRELLANAKLEQEEENQVRLACLALYVEYLVIFLSVTDGNKKNKKLGERNMQGCPPRIKNYIMNEYTQKHKNKRVCSRQNYDRAMCCILVLSLIGSKYQLAVNTLLLSLMVTRDKLNSLMKIIGATYSRTKQSFILKIPIPKLNKPFKKSGFKNRK